MLETTPTTDHASAYARAHALRAGAFIGFWNMLISAARPHGAVTREKGACGPPEAPCLQG